MELLTRPPSLDSTPIEDVETMAVRTVDLPLTLSVSTYGISALGNGRQVMAECRVPGREFRLGYYTDTGMGLRDITGTLAIMHERFVRELAKLHRDGLPK